MRSIALIAALAGLALAPAAASADPGDLDPSFGDGGILVSRVDERAADEGGEFEDVLALPGGKVLAVGTTYRKKRDGARRRPVTRVLVARFRPGGRLDRTFSDNGIVLINTPERDEGQALAAAPNGKILVGIRSGHGDQYGSMVQVSVARLWANGKLDRTFAGDGIALSRFGERASTNELVDLTADSAGRPVAVGKFQEDYEYGSAEDVSVLRLTPNGRHDSSFSGNGKLVLSLQGFARGEHGDIGLYSEGPTGVAIDRQNRVVIAGDGAEFPPGSPATGVYGLVRLTPAGALDETFSEDGWLTESEPRFLTTGVTAVENDELLVGGGEPGDFGVLRFSADGTPDSGFGEDGLARAGLTGVTATGFGQAPDGALVVGGHTGTRGVSARMDFAAARFLRGGSVDSSFGTNGAVRTSLRRGDVANALAIEPGNGRIVLAGGALTRRRMLFYALARYLP